MSAFRSALAKGGRKAARMPLNAGRPAAPAPRIASAPMRSGSQGSQKMGSGESGAENAGSRRMSLSNGRCGGRFPGFGWRACSTAAGSPISHPARRIHCESTIAPKIATAMFRGVTAPARRNGTGRPRMAGSIGLPETLPGGVGNTGTHGIGGMICIPGIWYPPR